MDFVGCVAGHSFSMSYTMAAFCLLLPISLAVSYTIFREGPRFFRDFLR